MPSGLHNWSTTAATNATADSAINWAEGQAPSSVNDSARAMMAVVAKWRDDNNGSLTTGGTSTAYTLTTNTVFTSLALMANQTVAFTMHTTSGATPTLNVDGLGAKTLRYATGVTLPTATLLSGSVYRATYNNSTGEWLIQNQAGVLPTNSVATGSIADAAVTYAKIQNVAASSLIGNATGSPAAPTAIGIGSDLSFSGTTLNPKVGPTSLVGYLSGLELSTAGGSAIMGIAVGSANDVAQGDMMTLASAYTKTTASWAVGTGNGGLDTGSIAANTWYHFFLIKRPDTGVVDVLFSTSATAPTMPANYTLKRRIGSMKTTAGSVWTTFTQTGDDFILSTMVAPGAISNNTSAVLQTLEVPTGIVVTAKIRVVETPGAGNLVFLLVSSPQESDQAPTATGGASVSAPTNGNSNVELAVLTNTSAQVRFRASQLTGTYAYATYGWTDRRGK